MVKIFLGFMKVSVKWRRLCLRDECEVAGGGGGPRYRVEMGNIFLRDGRN